MRYIAGIGNRRPPEIVLKVIPNPASGLLTFQFPVQKTNGELEVYDVMGNLVHKEYVAQWSQYKRMDISLLPRGIYLCRMKWENKEARVKIIMERG